ncbi:hypothetical protein JEZ13_09990 [bacterium]|nr:hypothetical protein [bacterium]
MRLKAFFFLILLVSTSLAICSEYFTISVDNVLKHLDYNANISESDSVVTDQKFDWKNDLSLNLKIPKLNNFSLTYDMRRKDFSKNYEFDNYSYLALFFDLFNLLNTIKYSLFINNYNFNHQSKAKYNFQNYNQGDIIKDKLSYLEVGIKQILETTTYRNGKRVETDKNTKFTLNLMLLSFEKYKSEMGKGYNSKDKLVKTRVNDITIEFRIEDWILSEGSFKNNDNILIKLIAPHIRFGYSYFTESVYTGLGYETEISYFRFFITKAGFWFDYSDNFLLFNTNWGIKLTF